MKKLNVNVVIHTILLFSLIFIAGCESSEKKAERKLDVVIDSNKIGELINDEMLGVEFNSPVNWVLMKSEVSEKNESMLRKRRTKERYLYKPDYVFFNDSTRSFLSVGLIYDNLTESRNDSLLTNYICMLEEKYNGSEFHEEIITTNNIVLHKFFIKMPQIISYKLVFQNPEGKLIQFEYTVPVQYFTKENKAIGSSIASINRIK